MTNTITLPRSVVEQALKAWSQARGALAYVAVGNAPSNPNLARSTCSQAVWVLDDAEPALRAALEQPQVEQKQLTDEELYKVFPAIASYTEANKALYRSIARVVERAVLERLHPKREPLTDEEIFNAIRPLCNNDTNCHIIIGLSIDEYRAIERAHGIGGEA